MTSLLTNVLAIVGQRELIEMKEIILKTEKEITSLQYEVKDFMEDNFVEFTSTLTRVQNLVRTAETLMDGMTNLQERLKKEISVELSGCTEELETLSLGLKESNASLELSKELLNLHNCLETVEKSTSKKATAEILRHTKLVLNNPQSMIQDLGIYPALVKRCDDLYSSFVKDVSRIWHKKIQWLETKEYTKDGKNFLKQNSLQVKSDSEDIQDLIQGLNLFENLINHLDKFSTMILERLIDPVITKNCSISVTDETIFVCEIHDTAKLDSNYEKVFYDLGLLFKFLDQHFNMLVDEERLLRKMKPFLLTNFKDKLIENCLSKTIPKSNKEMKNFQPVVETIDEFQNYLIEIGFITKEELFLTEYTQNIDQLFIDRICQNLLVRTRTIIKKDLHDSMRYEPQRALKFSTTFFKNCILEDRILSEQTFQFPSCCISKSAKEILDLGKEILNEACDSSDKCALKLFYTCRNIFEMYAGLIPEQHKIFLETIPQQSALFHNNCMYLAHNLLTCAHEYQDKLPPILLNSNITFTDQSILLRDTGSEYFLNHMKYQKDIIIDIIKQSGLSIIGETPQLPADTERVLRQCIRQLELLKTVWIDVLPVNVYNRAMGTITNSMIDELITRIISVEDIPADVARDLVVLFNMIVKRVPPIFPEVETIETRVRKWTKFTELISVLGASLKEIELRWNNGTGPLAREFTSSQVKQLIRALFQNTTRRSMLLSNIK